MGTAYSADEIFEMAEQLERNGAKFYREAAEKVDDELKKKMLLQLAKMEDNHEQKLKEIRGELIDREKGGMILDPKDENVAYLHALADIGVFYKKQINLDSYIEILRAAIDAEKDTIVFYLGVMDLVPKNLGKAKIEKIIHEERMHLQTLGNALAALSK